MNEKFSLYNIAELVAEKTGIETAEIEKFIIELITLINEGIRKDGIVRIKGFGIFKIILVKERESVHINTGERIVIPAHHKLSFKPEDELKELINQPFSIFETIEALDDRSKKDFDLPQTEIKEDAVESEMADSKSLISDYEIIDEEIEPDQSEEEQDDVDIIPPAPIHSINQQEVIMSTEEKKDVISPLPEDKPITKVTISSNEDNEKPWITDKIQKDEVKTTSISNHASSNAKSKYTKKKKSKPSSLMPFYLILILLLFVLAGCMWYYFAYSRSFDSFNKSYSTKVSNDTFVLPGDSASEQQAQEKANIQHRDTANVKTGSYDSEIQSDKPSANSEVPTSKPINQPASSTSTTSTPAATTTKKQSAAETNNTNKVLAKIKMEPGNRLTLVAEKYYGNKIFWVYIYEYNKEKIGSNPNNVKAGMEILVPTKETYGIDANSADSREKARKIQAQLMSGI